MRVDLVHGIHTTEGPGAFPALIAPFFEHEGFSVESHYYGHIMAVQTRWKNPRVVEELMDTIPDGGIYVGHSNGCTLAWMLAEAGKKFRGVVLINPALDRNKVITPRQAGFVHTYFNKGDCAVSLSRVLAFHPWGEMGKKGPSFEDPRYRNFNTGEVSGMPAVSGHSTIYTKEENRKAWGPFIAHQARGELDELEMHPFASDDDLGIGWGED